MSDDRDKDNILNSWATKCGFISEVPSGSKLGVAKIEYHEPTMINGIYRAWNGDGRIETVNYITSVFEEGLDLLRLYPEQKTLILSKMESMTLGIRRQMEVYTRYPKIKEPLKRIIERISETVEKGRDNKSESEKTQSIEIPFKKHVVRLQPISRSAPSSQMDMD